MHWEVVAPKIACPNVELCGHLQGRSWISVGESTAAEVKSGDVRNGTDAAAANFVVAQRLVGMLAESLLRGCKILPSLSLASLAMTYQRGHKDFQDRDRKWLMLMARTWYLVLGWTIQNHV